MKIETREVYVAEDGKIFHKEDECLAYEAELIKNRKALGKLKAYRINYAFEATEGRGHQKNDLIITDCSEMELLHFCFETYGKILRPWYAGRYYPAWSYHKCESRAVDALASFNAANEAKPKFGKGRVFFLTDKGWHHTDLPEPTPPWKEAPLDN
jgi:predicted dithiol-disulfide oxidoreductase (DUF899 family)